MLKYVAVRETLLEQIERGEYAVGEMIPSERELMDAYGVSRITVRKALDSLVQDGHLNRVQGKGTYVREGIAHDLISLTSVSEDMRSRGMVVTRVVLELGRVPADHGVAEALGISVGDEVLLFNRVFLADAQPVNRTLSFLPLDLFPGIDDFDLARQSLYELIEGEYGIEILSARRMLNAVLANELDEEILDVSVGDPLIHFQGFVSGLAKDSLGQQTERIIETFTTRYRSEPNRFDISQIRMPKELRREQ